MATYCKAFIEIPILLICFCWLLSEYVTTNFIIYRTCYVSLGYNQTECALLGTNNASADTKDLETKVQPTANIIIMSKTIIEVIITVCFSLIIGPWSNKHGRKPILISSFTGFFFCYLGMVIFCLLNWISPWYYLMPSIAACLGGGVCSLLAVCFCYVADTSTENNRGIRMGILEGCFSAGSLIGTISISFIFNSIGYIGIYITCSFIMFIAILYIYFLVPESVQDAEKENMIKDLLDKSVIIKTVKTCFKRRQNMDRVVLFLLMTMLILYIFVIFSDGSIFYLFVREKFNWSLQQYTLFSSVSSLIDIFCAIFILIVLHKLLKVNDMILVLFGFIALSTSYVIYGLATTTSIIYLGSVVKRISCVVGPLGRSAISKIIPPDDLGHVFAFTTSLETIVQLIAAPLYTLLYNATISTAPSAFNFLSASIYGLNVIITSSVIFIKRKYPNEYSPVN